MKKKPKTNAKHKRESAMISKLQSEHGYTFMEPNRGMEKTQLMFDRKTKKTSVAIVMRVAFPEDSALGQGVIEYRNLIAKKSKVK